MSAMRLMGFVGLPGPPRVWIPGTGPCVSGSLRCTRSLASCRTRYVPLAGRGSWACSGSLVAMVASVLEARAAADAEEPFGSAGGQGAHGPRGSAAWIGRSCVTPVFIAGRMAPAYSWAPW
jgi:hypothetical protein